MRIFMIIQQPSIQEMAGSIVNKIIVTKKRKNYAEQRNS